TIITPLPPFTPDLYTRAWSSAPHPSRPLLATAHHKSVTVFSLADFSRHSVLTGGHARSVRTAAWRPGMDGGMRGRRLGLGLGLVTGSFDATAGLWSFGGDGDGDGFGREVRGGGDADADADAGDREWEFDLVLEGHENEVKGLAFSAGGQYLATCSRDKSVWIWEDVGAGDGGGEEDDEWETVAVLNEHDGDVKAVAWCPAVPNAKARGRHYSADVLASASYDNTVRIWREDADGEWVCVAVLEGHEGTVWGLQWEGRPRADGRFPRLLTFSADQTIRVWSLKQEEEEEEEKEGEADDEAGHQQGANPFRSGFGGLPNTMRRSLKEEWHCTAVLPKVHTRDVYSAAWSAETGLVASTGSDGLIVLYAEDESMPEDTTVASPGTEPGPTSSWRVLDTVSLAHGPYEVNHITWCKRYDPGAEAKGKEEMLVSTGDDGVVRPWQVRI
ncbi:WD40 repeat-like protein, partial [Trichocladium antarcticum]